ncbi:MAG: hypothetical protein GX351_07475 [Peptococcaceae bacterium]|nr:hypothetical protein [Peptococcaceae bacterium]
MFTRKTDNSNWVMMGSALLGGFLLGMSYKKYGKELRNGIRSFSSKKQLDFDTGYTTSHEPDA